MSIEEMALKAYPKVIFKPAVEVVSSIDEKSTRIDYNEAKRTVYIEGAKAVLEEIEKALPFSIRYGYANEKIVEVIKQLKG